MFDQIVLPPTLYERLNAMTGLVETGTNVK